MADDDVGSIRDRWTDTARDIADTITDTVADAARKSDDAPDALRGASEIYGRLDKIRSRADTFQDAYDLASRPDTGDVIIPGTGGMTVRERKNMAFDAAGLPDAWQDDGEIRQPGPGWATNRNLRVMRDEDPGGIGEFLRNSIEGTDGWRGHSVQPSALVSRRYGSAIVPQDVARDLSPAGEWGFTGGIPPGQEFNALDQIAHERHQSRADDDGDRDRGRGSQGSSKSDSVSFAGRDRDEGDSDDRRESARENHSQSSPTGFDSRGVNDEDGPGTTQSVSQPERENHSVNSPTGFSSRGVNDLDGPEAAGAGGSSAGGVEVGSPEYEATGYGPH